VGHALFLQSQSATDDGLQRELAAWDGERLTRLPRLSRTLGLNQFARVAGAYGEWPTAIWLEVHVDLISSRRVELHRVDVKRETTRMEYQAEGTMQAKLVVRGFSARKLSYRLSDPLLREEPDENSAAASGPLPDFRVESGRAQARQGSTFMSVSVRTSSGQRLDRIESISDLGLWLVAQGVLYRRLP